MLEVPPQAPPQLSIKAQWYNSAIYLISNGVLINEVHIQKCCHFGLCMDKEYEFKLWPGSLSSWGKDLPLCQWVLPNCLGTLTQHQGRGEEL